MEKTNLKKKCSCLYNDSCLDEIKQCNKHDIIVGISDLLGECPSHLCMAEDIFEKIKYDVTRYILEHEYEGPEEIGTQVLLWLEEKSNPNSLKKLNDIVSRYLSI